MGQKIYFTYIWNVLIKRACVNESKDVLFYIFALLYLCAVRYLQVSPSDGFILEVDLSSIQQVPSLSLSLWLSLYLSENTDSLFCNAIIEETITNSLWREGWGRKEKIEGARERISVLLQLSSPLTGYWFMHFVGAVSLSWLPLRFAAQSAHSSETCWTY